MDYSVFVKQLIKDMTLEEKIRQTQMLDDFNDLLEEGEFSPRKADEVLKGNSIGCVQIFQLGDLKKTPEQLCRLIDDLQDYLKKHTRHGIPALVIAESLHGVIAQDATVFPQIIGLSSSWNEDLVGRVAECISEEAESLGVNQVLAPDLDLARDPRWGRVEETYGEDPYLTGVMGSRYVRGIQKNHRVASTLKHYVAHGTPESGVNLSPVNAGERQVRELYLPPFAEAMKEKPLSVMPAYSEIDGIPCSCSSHVLTEILREELGFDGYTISDYMAVEMLHNFHHTAETPAEAGRQALEAGMDLEAPNEYGFGQKMLELVQKGEISMEALDRAVERILSVKARLGLFEENVPESVRRVDMEAHRKLALKAAEESIVLLKNENHILPLKETVKNIAVIGPNAAIAQLGDYCSAGGTGVSLLEGLKELYSGTLHYVQGSTLYQKIPGGIREAVEAAEKSDVVLLALGGSGSTYGGIGWGEDGCGEVTSGEGFDSVDIRLSVPQLELAEHVLDTGKPVILILEDGRPCAIPEIYDRAGAVIQAWYPGQEGGRALAEILFGKVNPSGKLTVSIPKHVGQIPVCYNRKPSTGGFYHRPGTPEKPGRDYTTMDTKPYYSFGYGLSYTSFAYSNLEIQGQKNGAVIQVDAERGNEKMETLKREDIIRVIEGKGHAERVPLLYDIWIYDNMFGDSPERRLAWQRQYPCDVDHIFMQFPGMTEGPKEDPDFFWGVPGTAAIEGAGLDSQCLIRDWEDEEEVEAFYASFPDPDSPALIVEDKPRDGRYLLGRWWDCFFEKLWRLRGMENALTDFYLYPEQVHRLFDRLCRFYMRAMERAKEAWDVDGFFVSDDIGTQKAPFFSLDIFREFFKDYYKRLFDKAHELGTHFWLHSCGDIEMFLPEFIEIGLDVIHPIQKNTMDEREIARKYGDKICIFAGIDVQYLMAFGTTEEVEAEVKFLMDTYKSPDGRLMLTMGNGSTPDWKLENLDAMYAASMKYGRFEN